MEIVNNRRKGMSYMKSKFPHSDFHYIITEFNSVKICLKEIGYQSEDIDRVSKSQFESGLSGVRKLTPASKLVAELHRMELGYSCDNFFRLDKNISSSRGNDF
jgi:hypothetical protein